MIYFRYTSYEIFSDSGISSMASKIDTRYSTSSLFGVIFDVTMMSECDYIVCTFSSQVTILMCALLKFTPYQFPYYSSSINGT